MHERGRLEELYRRHAQALFRFAYGLARDRSQAEDIVAETFARILTRADRIERQTARAYLFATARNVFLDGRRSAARQARLAGEMAHEPAMIAPNDDERERLAHALHALGALPEGERAALLLRLDHGLSYEEIASTLGVSVAAAKVRVHRARLKLVEAQKTGGWDDES